jgi:outer membrane protein
MRKIIFSAIFACLFVVNSQAQDDKISDGNYDKWQARVRVLYVAPSPYFFDNVNGVEVDISSSFAPGIDVSYFFSRKMSAELMFTTSTHDVEIKDGADLGNISLLSPTLSLQHHFYLNKFKPYLGAGLSYTAFYGEDPGELDAIEYKNEVGYLIQAGIDYNISDKWFLNIDFKKIFLKSEVTANNDSSNTAEVNLDPIMLGFGVGMKF